MLDTYPFLFQRPSEASRAGWGFVVMLPLAGTTAADGALDDTGSSPVRPRVRLMQEDLGIPCPAIRVVSGATFGALPGPLQTSPRAELWAALSAKRIATQSRSFAFARRFLYFCLVRLHG